jgi:hypothetical protein
LRGAAGITTTTTTFFQELFAELRRRFYGTNIKFTTTKTASSQTGKSSICRMVRPEFHE